MKISIFGELREKLLLRQHEKFTVALMSDKIRIWDIPVRIRRGDLCRSLYIAAFRYARDSGKGRDRFMEDYEFLRRELKEVTSLREYEHLAEAYETVHNHAVSMKYFY